MSRLQTRAWSRDGLDPFVRSFGVAWRWGDAAECFRRCLPVLDRAACVSVQGGAECGEVAGVADVGDDDDVLVRVEGLVDSSGGDEQSAVR